MTIVNRDQTKSELWMYYCQLDNEDNDENDEQMKDQWFIIMPFRFVGVELFRGARAGFTR